jgi:2-(1,2-epoxy-1,2-dihydrophenyl)acetyl-CoA isomerase
VEVERSLENGVGRVEINRTDRMNSLTVDVAIGLGVAAEQLVKDGAGALVIAGRGSVFCAGADLSLVKSAFAAQTPEEVLTPLVHELHASIRRIRDLPVPVVAAVEGPAVGAGLGLALTADLRVTASDAQLVPGYTAIGSSPDGGVSYYLARMLGPAVAARVLLLNETLTAERGRELGLVDEVVEPGTATAAATALAQRLSNTPPMALLRTRRLLDAATSQDLSRHLDLEQQLVTELWETADFREGVSAFLERRKPRFRGA